MCKYNRGTLTNIVVKSTNYRFKMRTYIRKKLQVQEIEDVHALCRLCLVKPVEKISIFDDNANNIFSGLPMRITMCLGLEVSKDDLFPKFICQLCNSELDKFYTFKKQCVASYRKLKASVFDIQQTGRKKADQTQSLDQNKIPRSKSELEEENRKQEKVLLDETETGNSTGEANLKTEKGHYCKTPIHDELSQLRVIENNDNRLNDEAEEIVDVVKTHESMDTSKNTETTQCLPEFIVTSLVDQGVLARTNDALEILDQSVTTFSLETQCGSEIILELVEEDPISPEDECNKSHPKIFEPSSKSGGCCGTCGARFQSRGALVRHERVHSGEKPFVCRACGRRFAQREVLRRHQLVHADKLPYQCPQCPKSYTQRGSLAAHARSHRPPAALRLLRCSRCPKLFLYPSGLSRHMSVHQGRQFPCEECARTFADQSSLRRHRRAHRPHHPPHTQHDTTRHDT